MKGEEKEKRGCTWWCTNDDDASCGRAVDEVGVEARGGGVRGEHDVHGVCGPAKPRGVAERG